MTLKKILSQILLIVLFLLITNRVILAGESESDILKTKLKSATEYDYPPYSVTEDGKADGFSVELLQAVIKEIGLDIDFEIDHWNVIKNKLKNGELDVLPLVGYNTERDEFFDFTVPYIIISGNIFIRQEDEGIIRTEEDLAGKQLIVMQGDNTHEYAMDRGWASDLILTDTFVEAFKLLDSGQYDAVFCQSIVGESIINELGLKNIVPVYRDNHDKDSKIRMQLTGFEQKFCFAVREGEAELLAKLNEGLAIVSANGTYDKLYKKWFPFLVETGPSITQIVLVTASILTPILILLLLFSVRIIRKQVKEKTKWLEAQNKQVEYISQHDGLTGLYNRRYFDAQLLLLDKEEFYPLTMLVADVDGLKLINDTLGHQVGDRLIKQAGMILSEACRESDVIARWGGDEFACILPKTDEAQAEVIVKKIEELSSQYSTEYGRMSLSIGYETKHSSAQSLYELFSIAEEYMYKRKISGTEGIRGHLINTIIKTLFEKSPRDKEHSDRVSELATQLSKALNLRPSEISDIRTIGLLHDIGKIVVPQHILDKEGKLDDDEWNQIRQHPAIGYRILSTSDEFAHIAKGVLYHHERIDGTGYPEGMSGKNIPIESKVISVADAYDAMTAYRAYKKRTLTKLEAAIELKNNINTQFDAVVVKVFISDVLSLNWEDL